ncbi:PaaX family transcriptional regulator [Cryptosporangium arvum]|uniref:PaaX family transcriptional regulator n=1 Tax=Cryptosporangium arvum TaxID=80871 RepID=UPI0004BACAA5|nr:PaaX family transcriptional regulator C-terminal domain-containing protein [Cryptosporangium arvum]
MLPRARVGANPQHLLVTLLGDFWLDEDAEVPLGAVVEMMAAFGTSTASARRAISRLADRGTVLSTRTGRRARLRLSPAARASVREAAGRIMRFGRPGDDWDGHWTLVAFSVPEERRQVRHQVRTALRWLGFGALFDGVWISPRTSVTAVEDALRGHALDAMSIFRVETVGSPPLEAWPLAGAEAAYLDVLATYRPIRDRVRAGAVGGAEALVARVRLMDAWRRIPALDPGLPDPLLPKSWPRAAGYALFAEVYDTLGPLAEYRARQVVTQHDPDLATVARHHASADW